MTSDTLMQIIRSFWIVWVAVFFTGIVLWAYWPKNKAKTESWGNIPFQDDDTKSNPK
ncbi:MAG TPA: cbb3-type cytochrome c oxidase subunit 3 [Patescibacteria group bacterium]|nr:cbb3-type cytochrome c oxidase subunit 3 [Patescibacteria group bacterium]